MDYTTLSAIANKINQRGLSVPAIFLLEMLKPLVFLGLSGAQAATPFLKMVLGVSQTEQLIELLSSRQHIEDLIQSIEKSGSPQQGTAWEE